MLIIANQSVLQQRIISICSKQINKTKNLTQPNDNKHANEQTNISAHTHTGRERKRERYTLDTGKTRWHLIELIT